VSVINPLFLSAQGKGTDYTCSGLRRPSFIEEFILKKSDNSANSPIYFSKNKILLKSEDMRGYLSGISCKNKSGNFCPFFGGTRSSMVRKDWERVVDGNFWFSFGGRGWFLGVFQKLFIDAFETRLVGGQVCSDVALD
jgi:hypothetical protein